MRPLAVLTAIVFGSATAITFGLVGSLIVFLVLQHRHPVLAQELPMLVHFSVLFVALSTIAGAALYGLQKYLLWRWWAQAVMWMMVAFVAWSV